MTKVKPEGESGRSGVVTLKAGFASASGRRARAHAGTRGTAAIEFALVMPVLLSLTMGILEFGWLYYVENQMAFVARAVTRDVSAGIYGTVAAKTEAENRLDYLPGFTGNVVVQIGLVGNDVVTEISVPMADAALINFLNLFGSGTLNANVIMRKTV